MAEDLRRKVADLEREASALRAELEGLEGDARKLAEERDRINSRVRELRHEAAKFKGERDALNEEVKSLKAIIYELKREYNERIHAFRELGQRIREHLRSKPPRDEESLMREIAEIDWKIQTTPLSIEEERKLIERVKSLESQLSFYRRLNSMIAEREGLKRRLDEIKGEIASFRERVSEVAAKSQSFHEKMIECLKRADELRAEADKIHEKYRAVKERANTIRLRYRELLNQISDIKRLIREEEDRKRAEAISVLKEKISREALEKLKRGEKISFDEFKILAEQGKI
ncbi:MAG: hypothetical protein QXS09_00200 [Candidatus Bathyarchaeia archaeon]